MVVVGLLTVEVALGEGFSLKDKRHVIRSLLDTIRHRYNISAAETDFLDNLRKSEMAFAVVANQQSFANSVLEKVIHAIESDPRVSILDSSLEFI